MAVPAPIQVQPGTQVLGSDGNWPTFQLRVGTPPQFVNVIPSTLISEDWLVSPQGCPFASAADCTLFRGGLFDNTTSSSYESIGGGQPFTLGTDGGIGLNGSDPGYYGYDTVGLTASDGSGIVLEHQVVASIQATDVYVGQMGLSTTTVNLPTTPSNNQSTFLVTLHQQNKIPSLSYSYTAGAYYRNSAPDLTLGGQDLSRLEPNTVNFTMDSFTRDLTVGLQSITSTTAGGDSSSLLTDVISISIDSTLPYLGLPQTVCDAFVSAFGLESDEPTGLYSVSSSAREKNIKNNATIVFQLANQLVGGQSVNITFPYAAFDLTYIVETSSTGRNFSYFPIRLQTDPSAYTLGRSFLQEGYISVNHDYQNFSIFQTVPSGSQPAHIVALPGQGTSTSGTPTGPSTPVSTHITVVAQSSGFPTGAIAGIVIAVVLVIVAVFGFLWWRRRRNSKERSGGYHATPVVAPAPGMPELSEKVQPAPQDSGDYFGPAATKDSSAYHATAAGALSSDGASPGELESPRIGSHSGMSSPEMQQAAQMGSPSELDYVETPRAELPSRGDSQRMTGRMSHGPSPSLNPQGGSATAGSPRAGPSRTHPSWPDTHFEDISPKSARPSLMSADSVSFSNVGAPSIIHHSRNRSSGVSGVQSPPHSAGPSVDDSIFMATRAAYSDAVALAHSPTAIGQTGPALRRTASQDTLVNSNGGPSGRASPTTERHTAPQQEENMIATPVDGPAFDIPGGFSMGYASERERRQRREGRSSEDDEVRRA